MKWSQQPTTLLFPVFSGVSLHVLVCHHITIRLDRDVAVAKDILIFHFVVFKHVANAIVIETTSPSADEMRKIAKAIIFFNLQ